MGTVMTSHQDKGLTHMHGPSDVLDGAARNSIQNEELDL